VPLAIFRNRNLSGANAAMAAVYEGNLGMFFLITLYLQLVEHYSPIGTAIAFLPIPVILGLVAAGIAWVCFLPVHGNYALHLLPGLLVMPAGYGMSYPSAYAAATSGVPGRQVGLASGLITTAHQMGGAVGLAVISAVAASYTASLTRDSGPRALTSGYNLAMAAAAGITLLASVIAATVIRARRPAPRRHVTDGRQRREARSTTRQAAGAHGEESRAMRIALAKELGGINRVELGDRPDPAPAAEQALIRIHGAGVGPWDVGFLRGDFPGLACRSSRVRKSPA
jgi:hypothetical protein